MGRCIRNEEVGIRWCSLRQVDEEVRLAIYETADFGDETHLDLYEFGPLDPELELDQPTQLLAYSAFADAADALEKKFPGATAGLVNEGVLQDEYLDYIRRGRR